MKYVAFFRQTLLAFGATLLLTGCPNHTQELMERMEEERQFYEQLPGMWAWQNTVTPTRVLTPQSEGYTEQMIINKPRGPGPPFADTIQLLRNGRVVDLLTGPARGTLPTGERQGNTVDRTYTNSQKQRVYFTLSFKGDVITTSGLRGFSNVEYDTLRIMYRRVK